MLAKTFCRDLQRHLSGKRELKVAHINCRNASTSMRVAQRILHQFDPGHPDRGLSLGEMLLSLRKMLRRTSTHLIVVLDEVTTCYDDPETNCCTNFSVSTRTKKGREQSP